MSFVFSLVLSVLTLFILILGVLGFSSLNSLRFLAGAQASFNIYLFAHVLTAMLAYACFALSFIAGLIYLFQDLQLKRRQVGSAFQRLPSLEGVERFIFRTLSAGLPLLTVALLSGFVWMKSELGTFWLWNSKITASLFAWVVYAALFYFHFVSSIHGRRMVILAVLAFTLILFVFLGMNLFEMQVESYAHLKHWPQS